jgi:hypothetical protein
MVFTLEEIRNYLLSQENIYDAIKNLSEESITSLIEDTESLNFEKSESNLVKYEMAIGMTKIKEQQTTIYRNSNGSKGKTWLALSPKWINGEEHKKNLKTIFDICYWVNYGDNEDTYGWFSVEQIKEWLMTPELKLSSSKK